MVDRVRSDDNSNGRTAPTSAAPTLRSCPSLSIPAGAARFAWLGSGATLFLLTVLYVLDARGVVRLPERLWAYLAASLVYVISVWALRFARPQRMDWCTALVSGLLMRAILCCTPDSLDGDYFRYMWDGAAVANFRSPYAHAPQAVLDGLADDSVLTELAGRGRNVLERVNHPSLRTIYPPAAQVLFALAYVLSPFSSVGWRVVLLVLDLSALLLLWAMLRREGRPLTWLTTYWWNPLLLIETYHFRHLDLTVAPFLLFFLFALWRRRPVLSGSALALAAGVKLWPLLLFPMLVARFRNAAAEKGGSKRTEPEEPLTDGISGGAGLVTAEPGLVRETGTGGGVRFVRPSVRRQGLAAATAFLLPTVVLLVLYYPAFGPSSGAQAYGKIWDANAWLYWPFDRLGWFAHRVLLPGVDGRWIARGLIIATLAAGAAWQARRAGMADLTQLSRRLAFVILTMLLLTPTLYPWYFIPLVALAPLTPSCAFLVWTPLLAWTHAGHGFAHDLRRLAVVHLPGWAALIALARRRATPVAEGDRRRLTSEVERA